MEKQSTEETMGERMTEETGAKNPTIDIGITVQLLIYSLLCFGWVLLVTFEERNVNVRGYIWLCSAAFHVIALLISTYGTIFAFRHKELKFMVFGSLVYLGMCLTSFISLIIWFCLDR